MKALLVGGTFNKDFGAQSSVANKMFNVLVTTGLSNTFSNFIIINGNNVNVLGSLVSEKPSKHNPNVKEFDYIFWFADVSNEEQTKWVEFVKERNPKCILVTSKNNLNGKYSFMELVKHALNLKSNLLVEFSGERKGLKMRLIDPLGNVAVDYTKDIEDFSKKMSDRVKFLKSIKRAGSVKVGEALEIPDEKRFFSFVRKSADIFKELIPTPEGSDRFLGNASFRCREGFPSFRKGKLIYVSKRNVDKCNIGRNGFVAVNEFSLPVEYYGDDKPSVDTPIQVSLYENLPNINYMLHGHVYVKKDKSLLSEVLKRYVNEYNMPMTSVNIPCGGLQEVGEVLKIVQIYQPTFCVNLKGHGFLMGAVDINALNEMMKYMTFVARPMPENLFDSVNHGPLIFR